MRKQTLRTAIIVVSSALFLSACGPEVNTLYSWNGYSSAVLTHYKDGTSATDFATSLAIIIQKSEAEDKVPPGLYAEYGYALLESGNDSQAIIYFQKERDAWPESEAYMGNIIFRLTKTPESDILEEGEK